MPAKQKIFESDNNLPSITGIGYLSYTHDADKPFSTDAVLAFQQEISPKFSMDWNIGIKDAVSEFYLDFHSQLFSKR